MICCAGLSGVAGASDIPRPYNTARQYPQIGQLRAPAHVWLPWDVLEDVVSILTYPAYFIETGPAVVRRRCCCAEQIGVLHTQYQLDLDHMLRFAKKQEVLR